MYRTYVIERVYGYGAIIRFLPPYSPDLNRIKEAFANVKHYLQQNDVVLDSVQDASSLIWNASCWLYLNYNVVLNNLKSRNKIKSITKIYRSLIYKFEYLQIL